MLTANIKGKTGNLEFRCQKLCDSFPFHESICLQNCECGKQRQGGGKKKKQQLKESAGEQIFEK